MKNKREDWIDVLREAATADGGHEPPEGLWERISADLDAAPPVAPRRRRLYVWAASAAAVAAAAAAVFMLKTSVDDTGAGIVPPYAVSVDSGIPAENSVQEPGEPSAPDAGRQTKRNIAETRNAVSRTITATPPLESARPGQNETHAPANTLPGTDVPAATGVPAGNTESQGKDKEPAGTQPAGAGLLQPREPVRIQSRKATARKGMLAVSTTGVASVSGGPQGNAAMPSRSMQLMPNKEGLLVMDARTQSYTYRHRQPLTFALSFDLGLGRNLFAGAGVSYTRLSSKATVAGGTEQFEQLLQYVGIPVTFKWAFLNSNLFMLYAGAEAQAEFCVDARFGGRKEDVRTMQWSVHALAGAQLNLGRHIGIYAEPKLSHYFVETELETIRNTRSVNFNLQLGLRFSY